MNNINCYLGNKKRDNLIMEKIAKSCNGKIFNQSKYRKGLSICLGLDNKIHKLFKRVSYMPIR